jgi:uncharacterized membrane protein
MSKARTVTVAFTLLLLTLAGPSFAQIPVVHAVLFYSPACPHCAKVITQDLPPLFEQYASQLEMIGVDVTQQGGQALYLAAVERFHVPEDRVVVPMLVVGETVLIGAAEIPQMFPGIIEQGIAQGGIDWPDIPGLLEAMPPTPTPGEGTALPASTQETSPAATPSITLPSEPASMGERFMLDPAGNGLAVVVLVGMVISVVALGLRLRRPLAPEAPKWATIATPLLSVAGIAISAYLTFIETSGETAWCGPVGDCNAVQHSPYARLFGVPIAALGLAGYVFILAGWLVGRYARKPTADWAAVAMFAASALGALFSLYLTFLEPFVIGASCAWCLASAVIMTILLWLTATPAAKGWSRLRTIP